MQLPRPLSIREVFQAGLVVFRHRFRTLIGASLLVLAPYLLASAYIRIRFLTFSDNDVESTLKQLEHATTLSQYLRAMPPGSAAWIALLVLLYIFLVIPLFFGIVVHVTSQHVTKRSDVTLAEAGNVSFRRLLPSVVTMVLACLLFVLAMLLYWFVLGLMVSLLSAVLAPLADVVGVIGSLAFLVGLLWFAVRAVYLPAIVTEEGLSFVRAVIRCWRMTAGQTARLVGFSIFLTFFLSIAQTLLTVIGDILFATEGGQLLVTVLVGLLITPFAYVCLSVMYLDLRTRRTD
ncbi:hypothetical protein [Alicyclobacillus acidiphilus]|uniref:hypothetical protein n=1 Tax=Alicyclobacillus acidiphilus TaxID=182455 RepID=UPI00082B8751|nr:hypothetical protein [Alicyclobacillus acidiphilus]